MRVRRHAGDQRGRALAVELLVRQLLQMAEQRRADIGREAGRRLRGEELCRDGEDEPRRAQRGYNRAHAQDVGFVGVADARVDDSGHQERNEQLHRRFEELEQRREDGLHAVGPQVFEQLFHACLH